MSAAQPGSNCFTLRPRYPALRGPGPAVLFQRRHRYLPPRAAFRTREWAARQDDDLPLPKIPERLPVVLTFLDSARTARSSKLGRGFGQKMDREKGLAPTTGGVMFRDPRKVRAPPQVEDLVQFTSTAVDYSITD